MLELIQNIRKAISHIVFKPVHKFYTNIHLEEPDYERVRYRIPLNFEIFGIESMHVIPLNIAKTVEKTLYNSVMAYTVVEVNRFGRGMKLNVKREQ